MRTSRPGVPVQGAIAVLFLLCLILFFWQLDSYSLFNHTEAKQAEIARQLWVRHDWITPVYNGELYFDKPILLHWLIALGFPIWGMNEWAVRLPSAIAATALVLSTWAFVRRVANPRMAMIAATLMAANPFTLTLGRTGQHDMLLVCFTTGAMYSWFLAYSTGETAYYLGFFALLALGVMAKGPVALVVCGLGIGLFVFWTGQWRQQWHATPWRWGLLVFGAITLPWYVLVTRANGWVFVYEFFGFNNVSRFVSANLDQAGPWYFYLPMVLVGFSPWIMVLPALLTRFPIGLWFRLDYWRRQPAEDQVDLFMSLWFVSVLVFMSAAATKLPWYIYPGLPGLAYLCAHAWDLQIRKPDRGLRVQLGAIALFYALMAIAFVLVPYLVREDAVQRLSDTSVRLIWIGLYGVGAIATGISALRRKPIWAWMIGIVVFSSFSFTLVNQLMPVLDDAALGGRLMPIVRALQRETCETCSNDVVAAFGVEEPSLNFYSRFSQIPRFEYPFDVTLQLHQPQRLLLVTTDEALDDGKLDFSAYQPSVVSDKYKLFIITPLPSSHTRRT